MKIGSAENVNYIPSKRDNEIHDMRQTEVHEGLSKLGIETEDVVSYRKMSVDEELFLYDPISIEKLAEESEDFYGHLIKLVKDVVDKQAKAIRLIEQFEIEKNMEQSEQEESNKIQVDKSLKDKSMVDEIILKEVKASILPKGRLGVETTSEKVTNFVKMASDDKMGKLKVLIDVIESTFEEIENTLGKMPELSQKTYDKISEKLDMFLDTTMFKEEPENVKFQLREMVKSIITEQFQTIEIAKKEELVKTGQNLLRKDSIDSFGTSRAGVLISEEGRLSATSIAERIVSFVKFATGQRGEGLEDLIMVIDKEFKELEQSLGVLPQLTQKTETKIKQDLEDWEYMVQMRKYPGPVFLIESRNFYRNMKRKLGYGIRGYIFYILGVIMFFHIVRAVIEYLK